MANMMNGTPEGPPSREKLIVWSGGCDSTLCLYNALKDEKVAKPVRAISIVHSGVGAAREQHRARQKILAWFKEHKLRVQHAVVNIKCRGDFYMTPNGSPQPMVWLPFAMLYLQKKQDMVFGYVRGDDFWHYREGAKWVFEYAKHFNHDATGKLEFPLEWTTKAEVLKRLKKIGLLKYCWWCENPTKNGKPCYKCHCCQVHRAAKMEAFK